MDRRDHHAQVGGHRGLQGEQAERLLLGRGAQVVDPDVVGDHLLGELEVGLQEGARRVLHRHRRLQTHVGEGVSEGRELFLVGVAHTASLVASLRRSRSGG